MKLQIKVVVIGPQNVGKHTLCSRFMQEHRKRTGEMSQLPSKKDPIRFWTFERSFDFPQERQVQISTKLWCISSEMIKYLGSFYLQGAHAVIYVQAVTNEKCVCSTEWLQHHKKSLKDCPLTVASTKNDTNPNFSMETRLRIEEEVHEPANEVLRELAEQNRGVFIKTSAREGIGLDHVFNVTVAAAMFKGGHVAYRRFRQTQRQAELLLLLRRRYFPWPQTRAGPGTWHWFYRSLVDLPGPAFQSVLAWLRTPVELMLRPE